MSIYVVHTKPSVKFDRILPAGFRILAKIDALPQLLQRDVFISCGTEAHDAGTPHSTGEAYDISVVGWSGEIIETALNYLRHELGPLFYAQFEVRDVAQDSTPSRVAQVNTNATAPHIHVQRRKATIYPPPIGRTVNA